MSYTTTADLAESSSSIYNQTFWLAFAANLFLVAANTLTFRFAEFVRFLGGTEAITGQIISIGLVGSLVWRLFLGQSMDRFGVRAVWIASTLMYFAGSLMIAMTTSVGTTLTVARILFSIGLASMLTCALAHVQGLAPPHRRTEIIASYGAAGFLGLIFGALAGDIVFQSFPEGSTLYSILFGLTTGLGLVHGGLGAYMTRDLVHTRPAETPAVHKLFVRYWPPMLLVVTLMMGLVLTVTTIFLTRYATHLGLSGIKTFFSAYALTAFLVRLMTRRWSQRVSRHHMIVYGLASHAVGQVLLLFVTQEWQFLPAAICFGYGHALLFPCIVSLGAGAFPEAYRGTGTTLCLAAIDLGTMTTAPVVGWMIDYHGFHPMLTAASVAVAGATVFYAVWNWRTVDAEVQPKPVVKVAPTEELAPQRLPYEMAIRPTRRDHRQQRPATTKAS